MTRVASLRMTVSTKRPISTLARILLEVFV